jgi:hypothetical protein
VSCLAPRALAVCCAVAEPPRPFELQVLPQAPFQPADLGAGTQGGSGKRSMSCDDEAGEQQVPGPPSVEWWLQQQEQAAAEEVAEAVPDGPPSKKLRGGRGTHVCSWSLLCFA